MSRSISPVPPRFISTTPVPQQILDQSGEVGPNASFTTSMGSFSSVPNSSFPPMAQSYANVQTVQGLSMMPPPTMSPLSAQASFDVDPFLPGSAMSLGSSQPQTFVVPASQNFAAPPTFPQMIPMQTSPFSAPLEYAPSMEVRSSIRATSPSPSGVPPPTLPQGQLVFGAPTALPTFPTMAATSATLTPVSTRNIVTTMPQLNVASPVGDPFKEGLYSTFPSQIPAPNYSQSPFLTNQGLSREAPIYAMPTKETEPVRHHVNDNDEEFQDGNVGTLFFILGFFVTLMLVLIPVWDGLALLDDKVWIYMAGDYLATLLVGCALSIPVLFVVTTFLLLSCGRVSAGARTEQTMLGAGVLFILTLGALLVTVSSPIADKAAWAKTQLLTNCETSSITRPLYLEYVALQKLHSTPACGNKESVEECAGFTSTSTSTALKDFEETMHCSGFCFFPTVNQTTPATTGNTNLYPPALFSAAQFQGSCSAMAARNMESFVADMAKQLMYEGFFLIAASIVQGFLMILGVITRSGTKSKRAGYGTLQQMVPPTDVTYDKSADIRRRPKVMEF